MNVARVRPTDALLGACGLVLLVTLFLDWYELPGGGVSGLDAFGGLDKLLFLVAALALLAPVVTAARDSPAWPVALLDVLVALACLTLLFLLYRLLDQPGPDAQVDAAAGNYAGAVALLATLLAGYYALRDERAPAIRSHGEVPVMPAPPGPASSSPTQDPA